MLEHIGGCPVARPCPAQLHEPRRRPPAQLWILHRRPSVSTRAKVSDEKQSKQSEQPTLEDKQPDFDLDTVNPWSVGRRTRQAFDDVWSRFTKLGSPVGTSADPSMLYEAPGEGRLPQAAYTRVLVIGATGRVGRVLIRKLLLRGYAVTALVRSLDGHNLPQSVRLVQGTVSDYASCQRALEGIDKVVYAAAPRSDLLEEHELVNEQGVATAAQAFQDFKNALRLKAHSHSNGATPLSNGSTAPEPNLQTQKLVLPLLMSQQLLISKKGRFEAWRLEPLPGNEQQQQGGQGQAGQSMDDVQSSGEDWASSLGGQAMAKFARSQRNTARRRVEVQPDTQDLYLNQRGSLVFTGSLHSRGSASTIFLDLETGQVPQRRLAGCEGLVIRVSCDSTPFLLQLFTDAGVYTHRFGGNQRGDFANVRLPFNEFRPEAGVQATLDPAAVHRIGIRRDSRLADARSQPDFALELLRIKALPGGEEPDFVLVSCAGTKARPGLDVFEAERLQRTKRSGEALLRQSGLGYVIVRPAQLLDEPGGYKALLFDQANRIQAGISSVDVADVCLRSLHEPNARNKAFEVCNEAPSVGTGAYELVAHLPNKASSYLGQGLASLEKNI